MAYIARQQASASGLYAFLERREREEYSRWEQSQSRRAVNGAGREEYPRQVRLGRFAAGRPVNVASGEILGWSARESGAPGVAKPVGRAGQRAIVAPDDSIMYTDDDWARLFIEENGL